MNQLYVLMNEANALLHTGELVLFTNNLGHLTD